MFRHVLPTLFLCLVPLGIMFAVYNLFTNARGDARRQSCASDMKFMGKALAMYAQDNDGQLPLNPHSNVVTGSEWTQDVLHYTNGHLFKCSASDNSPQMPNVSGYSDYWFNDNLKGQTLKKLPLPSATLMVGEGNDGQDQADASYSRTALPAEWLNTLNSPASRHLGGANYLMADGTVHWLRPEEVTTFGGRKNAFSVK